MLLLADEDDLRDVMSAVTSLAGRWKDLGISLGVCPGDLDSILFANPHSASNCLREMLLQWLRQSYNVNTTLILYLPYFNVQIPLVWWLWGSILSGRKCDCCLSNPPSYSHSPGGKV